ncbi:MAG TPA: deoxyribose-phosphate aldolase [Bacillota bacterium]|nr:deoxyribose-phosphate aldolase [Bacillota bacterium]
MGKKYTNEEKNILKIVDHTQLSITATWKDIKKAIQDAYDVGTASVCIPPCYVKKAAEFARGKMPICTVIGFPNGYSTTAVKVFEAKEAIANGATEIDMVINLCDVKSGAMDAIYAELLAMREACHNVILKVIIETCQLTDIEIVKLCGLISKSGCDFAKTSTGFSTAGATAKDVALMKKSVSFGVKVKAAGGIRNYETAEEMMNAGADRLGTSRLIK